MFFPLNGGSGEIRTHGPFTVVGFQDRYLKPLRHTSFNLAGPERIELPLAESYSAVIIHFTKDRK